MLASHIFYWGVPGWGLGSVCVCYVLRCNNVAGLPLLGELLVAGVAGNVHLEVGESKAAEVDGLAVDTSDAEEAAARESSMMHAW